MNTDNRLLKGLAGQAAPLVFKTLMMTLRWRLVDVHKDARVHREHGPVIWAFWHAQMAFPAFQGRNRGVRILISGHPDGELVARMVQALGYDPARGSSTRGGIRALKELARTAGAQDLAITPDGPLGPPERAQLGAILLAQLTARPLMPLGGAAYPRKTFNSWDRAFLPLPFARAALAFGDPIFVPRRLDAAAREEYRRRLEEELNRLTRRAEHACTSSRGKDLAPSGVQP